MVKRLEKINSGGGLYFYCLYQNVFGKLDFNGSGFSSKWRAIPLRPKKEIICALESMCSRETRSYISKTKKLPLMVRLSYLDGMDLVALKIDNFNYEFLRF